MDETVESLEAEVATAEEDMLRAQQRLANARARLRALRERDGGCDETGEAEEAAFPRSQPDFEESPATFPSFAEGASPQSQPAQGQAFSTPAYAQEAYRPVYAQAPLITKDHVAAGLLAIFLGAFGIHKFYLGYTSAGFIMLGVSIVGGILSFSLATWVVWVIAIVEGAIYLSKSQTDFERCYLLRKNPWF